MSGQKDISSLIMPTNKKEVPAPVDTTPTFRCPVCDTIGKWKNIDNVRLKPSGMCMCETCGIVQYPSKYQTEEEIKQYYRKQYRTAPNASNLFTGERKLQYHEHFLGPLIAGWKETGIDKPVIGEIGSAMGMFLNWIREKFPEADLHGTELTDSYRRVAFHEYGLNLVEDFDYSKKYDLIVSYHVLEHQLDPDIKLKQYAECLKDNGLFYLSAPVWFRDANNGATGGFDIEYYWATDHINAWHEKHLEWIIEKAGLEIFEKNDDIYGNTYLLKKQDANYKKKEQPVWQPDIYLKAAEKIYNCWLNLQENKTDMAIEAWTNCPAAWINHYELNRQIFERDKTKIAEFLNSAIKACPNSADILIFVGDVLSRYEHYDEAHRTLLKALEKKPNNPTILVGITNTFRMRARRSKDPVIKENYYKKSLSLLRYVMSISTESIPQCLSWVYQDEALLETVKDKKENPKEHPNHSDTQH